MCTASDAYSHDPDIRITETEDIPAASIKSPHVGERDKTKQAKSSGKGKGASDKRSHDAIRIPKEVRNGSRRPDAQRESIYDFIHARNKNLSRQTILRYADYIVQACEKYNQDPFAVTAMIIHESTAKNNAVSSGGDYGLMQVRWKVHHKSIKQQYPHIRKADDLFDPKYNILIGTEIFSMYRSKAGDLTGGLMRYSAGNRQLLRKVLSSMEKLEKLYQQHLKAAPKKKIVASKGSAKSKIE